MNRTHIILAIRCSVLVVALWLGAEGVLFAPLALMMPVFSGGSTGLACTGCPTSGAPSQLQFDISGLGSLDGTYVLAQNNSACTGSGTNCEYGLTGITSCNGNDICLYSNFVLSGAFFPAHYVCSLYIGCKIGGNYLFYIVFEKDFGTTAPNCITLSGVTGFTLLGAATHVCNSGGDLCLATGATITVTAIP